MATSREKSRHRTSEIRRIVGKYRLTGNSENTRLTISSKLDGCNFPNSIGTDVRVELVEPDEGDPYLEVHPAAGDL